MSGTRPLRAATLYPLSGIACGDDANGTALVRRATRRDIDLTHRVVQDGEPVPDADVYLLGGRGTAHLAALVARLSDGDTLRTRVGEGAAVLAVDAGLDALGHGVAEAGDVSVSGLGLLDVTTRRGPLRDTALVTTPSPDLALPSLVGWVQTDLVLTPGPAYRPFAALELGEGDVGTAEGAVAGRVLGTRLHGPLLAVNPEVADLLLAWATGQDPHDLAPLDDTLAHEARRRRITAELDARQTGSDSVVTRLAPRFRERRARA